VLDLKVSHMYTYHRFNNHIHNHRMVWQKDDNGIGVSRLCTIHAIAIPLSQSVCSYNKT
jgi:hypothetical protein